MSKVILGGGLTGLSAGFYLTQRFPKNPLTILEKSNRVGGWIKSNCLQNNTLFEQGPRTIRPIGEPGANTLDLIEKLDLKDEIIPITRNHPAAKNRMIYANGKLHLLPSSFGSIFKVQEPFSKPLITYLANDIFASRKIVNDESIYDFVNRRFSTEVADYLISAMICGICAGNAKEISVKFLMSKLFEYEQEFGSISRGLVNNAFRRNTKQSDYCELYKKAKQDKWSIYTFKSGIETLTKSLHNRLTLDNVIINIGTTCENLEFDKGCIKLTLSNGTQLQTDHLISTIPSRDLALLIIKQHPKLAELLNKIHSVSVGVVNLYFNKNLLKQSAFGFLVPPKEKLPILGVIFDSCIFPNNDNTVLTVMMGGYWFEEYFGKNPSETKFLEVATDQVKNILKITEKPSEYSVNILKNCIPQYVVGHHENLRNIEQYLKNNNLPLSLCGASYYGVGMNDVILSAKKVVDSLS